ncbi:FGGY-family carbohydrate kinase [Castellaniella sp.]|uniref:xylulokinase n=1 Tax=Castellaniella sp. TaxID=1955812 RepID=UPI00356B0BEA
MLTPLRIDAPSELPRSDPDAAVLAIDLGSARLKGAWVRSDGRLGPVLSVDSPVRVPRQTPEGVWQAVNGLMAALLHQADAPATVQALALTGLTRSHVFLDPEGQEDVRLVLWDDPYGEACAAQVAAAYGVPETRSFGAFHPLARLVQWRHDHAHAPRAMLELKDWLNYRLTGVLATDTVVYGRLWSDTVTVAQVLERLGMAASSIPAPQAAETILGRVQAPLGKGLERLLNVPVAVSSFDTWCATLGMGAIHEGGVYDISGTSEAMGAFYAQPRHPPGAVCLQWTHTLWHVGGPCQTGLGTLAWFARRFLETDDPAATLAAARQSTASEPPLCLPYVSGERMPWWDADLSASFHGVRGHHTRADFARAVVEGLALAHRAALDETGLRTAGGVIHMGGGGSRLPDWCQTRADAFAMPFLVDENAESALTGAALAASVALGYHPTLSCAQNAVRQRSRRVVPDPARVCYFEERLTMFSQLLHQALHT